MVLLEGVTFPPHSIQIIVKNRLSKTENLWLASLTNKLSQKDQAQSLLLTYGQHKTNPLYRSVMETITRNNRIFFEEDTNMCQTLEDIMDKREAKIKNATKAQLNALILKLAELGRMDDIIEAAKNPAYQDQLLEEFGL